MSGSLAIASCRLRAGYKARGVFNGCTTIHVSGARVGSAHGWRRDCRMYPACYPHGSLPTSRMAWLHRSAEFRSSSIRRGESLMRDRDVIWMSGGPATFNRTKGWISSSSLAEQRAPFWASERALELCTHV